MHDQGLLLVHQYFHCVYSDIVHLISQCTLEPSPTGQTPSVQFVTCGRVRHTWLHSWHLSRTIGGTDVYKSGYVPVEVARYIVLGYTGVHSL